MQSRDKGRSFGRDVATIVMVASLVALDACAGAVVKEKDGVPESDGAAPDAPVRRVPVLHRPAPIACPPTGPGSAGPALPCRLAAECTLSLGGRCEKEPIEKYGLCTYTGCTSDAECGPGRVCSCGDAGFVARCVEATCATDSDCGEGHCSPSPGACGPPGGVLGYFCHTPADKCIDDADCAPGYCAYDSIAQFWECRTAECVG